MLLSLQGVTHQVHTGVGLHSSTSQLTLVRLSPQPEPFLSLTD
jgi:hypothetical protein